MNVTYCMPISDSSWEQPNRCRVIRIRSKHKTTSTDINISHQIFTGERPTGNVIRELSTPSLLECNESECISIKFRATKRQDYSTNCQLIDASKTTSLKFAG